MHLYVAKCTYGESGKIELLVISETEKSEEELRKYLVFADRRRNNGERWLNPETCKIEKLEKVEGLLVSAPLPT